MKIAIAVGLFIMAAAFYTPAESAEPPYALSRNGSRIMFTCVAADGCSPATILVDGGKRTGTTLISLEEALNDRVLGKQSPSHASKAGYLRDFILDMRTGVIYLLYCKAQKPISVKDILNNYEKLDYCEAIGNKHITMKKGEAMTIDIPNPKKVVVEDTFLGHGTFNVQ